MAAIGKAVVLEPSVNDRSVPRLCENSILGIIILSN